MAQTLAPTKVRRAVGFVQPTNEFDAALLEHQDVRPVGLQAIGQENVLGAKDVPQGAEEADLALSLARILADSELQNGPTGEGNDGSEARDGKAQARLLL